MRLIALEFIRQSLNVDQVHFLLAKKGYLFKLPQTIGYFIVNNRKAMEEVEEFFKTCSFRKEINGPMALIKLFREEGWRTLVPHTYMNPELKLKNWVMVVNH